MYISTTCFLLIEIITHSFGRERNVYKVLLSHWINFGEIGLKDLCEVAF